MTRKPKKKKPTVLLSGYYGFDNIGDEAVLAAIVQQLKQHLPGVPFVVLSNDPAATKRNHGVIAVNRWDWRAVRQAMKECGLFISGGGSLLQDVTSLKGLIFYIAQILLARFYHKPVMIYAQGLGPLHGTISRFMVRWTLNRCQAITWRDEHSLALAREIGVKRPMQVVCDPVLAWQPEETVLPDLPTGKKIAFSLRPWAGMEKDLAALTHLGDALAKQGYHIVLLPFHKDEDRNIQQQLADTMSEPAFLLPDLPPASAWAVLGQMDLVVGMRLHALIMAAAQGVPSAALSYDPKVTAFMKATGQQIAGYSGNLQPHSLVGAVSEALAAASEEKKHLSTLAAGWREKAAKNSALAASLYQEQTGGVEVWQEA